VLWPKEVPLDCVAFELPFAAELFACCETCVADEFSCAA